MNLKSAEHRAIYFWAGPGTVRMNLLKHDLPIHEAAHLSAYGEYGVEKLVEMGITVVYCTFSWGFAPEVEAGDWAYFARFTELCHTRGIEVFAYIQSSNLVWEDWFSHHPESLDWLSRDRCGRPIVYAGRYPRRYYACYNHPGWQAQIMGEYKKALDYLDRGRTLARECGDISSLSYSYETVGGTYYLLGEWDQAIHSLKESLSLAEQVGLRRSTSRVFSVLGDIYRHQGLWAEADECYQRSLASITGMGNPQSLFVVNLGLALINMERTSSLLL